MKRKNEYWKWGLTLFLTACAVLIFYDVLSKGGMGGTLEGLLDKLMGVLAPVLYGCVMAYLLTPLVNWVERGLRALARKIRKPKLAKIASSTKLQRGVSILVTWLVVLLLIFLLMSVLIPQLADSVTMLISNAENYYNQVYNWANTVLEENTAFGHTVADFVNRYYSDALTVLEDRVLPWAEKMVSSLTGGIWSGILSVLLFTKNIIIGIIISVYLLGMKEKGALRCTKLVCSLFNEERSRAVIRATRTTDRIFSGFVRGKLLDSLIIGILCFIGCTILRFPYTPLISVVVGVTNIIPFFGPFLGAIPSALLILLVSPIKCLYFIIFVLVLQQFDGNILGPKILGSSTGISGFWVIVAILVGGGFFGVAGMFLGVPVFACLQALFKYLMNRRLESRGLPVEACAYASFGQEDTEARQEFSDD